MMRILALIKRLFSFLKKIKKLFTKKGALWLLPIPILLLLYYIVFKHNYSLRLIIPFCLLLTVWLVAVVESLIKPKGVPQEVSELAKKFKKEHRIARSRIYSAFYDLPFYIVMGETGAGKTTLVKSAKLRELADIDDEEKGVGGTQGCDWFLRKEAVFLDTAGLLSDNKELWEAFLTNVKNARPLYPANGILLVIPADQLCSSFEKDQVEDLADAVGNQHQVKLTQITEFCYNTTLGLPREKEMLLHEEIRSKAETLKDRLEELKAHLNFHLPIYLVISKCDMLAGFRSFSHILNQNERDKILGMASLQNFELFAEELRRWQVMKAQDDVDNMNKSWLFLENLLALRSRLQIYEEVFAGSTLEMVKSDRGQSYIRGYFLSSCKQHLVGTGSVAFNESQHEIESLRKSQIAKLKGKWSRRSHAYFVRELFHRKVLAEKLIGKPDIEFKIRREVIARRVKISGAVAILGLLLWMAGYFMKNYISFNQLEKTSAAVRVQLLSEQGTSKRKPRMKQVRRSEMELLDHVSQLLKDCQYTKTSSKLLYANWANEPLEKETQKLAIKLFYGRFVVPTFEKFLHNLGEGQYFKPSTDTEVDKIEALVNAVNSLVDLHSNYLEVKEKLSGFENFYEKVYPKKVNSELYNQMKHTCREIALLLPKISDYKEQLTSSLEEKEQQALTILRGVIRQDLQKRVGLSGCDRIVEYYQNIKKAHNDLLEKEKRWENLEIDAFSDFSSAVINVKRLPFGKDLRKKLLTGKDVMKFYESLATKDINSAARHFKQLKKENLFLEEEEAQNTIKKIDPHTLLATLENFKLEFSDKYEKLDAVYQNLAYVAWQIKIISAIEPLAQKDDWDKADIKTALKILKDVIENNKQDLEQTLPYEREISKRFWKQLTFCFTETLYRTHDEYIVKVGKANKYLLDKYSRAYSSPSVARRVNTRYTRKVKRAIEDATLELRLFIQLEKLYQSGEDLAINDETFYQILERLKKKKENEEKLDDFLASKGFGKTTGILLETSASEGSNKGKDPFRNTSADDFKAICAEVYDAKNNIRQCANLTEVALVNLRHNMSNRIEKKAFVQHWGNKCTDYLRKEEWKKLEKYIEIGKSLINKTKSDDSFFLFSQQMLTILQSNEKKIRGLQGNLYFPFDYIEEHKNMREAPLANTGSFFKVFTLVDEAYKELLLEKQEKWDTIFQTDKYKSFKKWQFFLFGDVKSDADFDLQAISYKINVLKMLPEYLSELNRAYFGDKYERKNCCWNFRKIPLPELEWQWKSPISFTIEFPGYKSFGVRDGKGILYKNQRKIIFKKNRLFKLWELFRFINDYSNFSDTFLKSGKATLNFAYLNNATPEMISLDIQVTRKSNK